MFVFSVLRIRNFDKSVWFVYFYQLILLLDFNWNYFDFCESVRMASPLHEGHYAELLRISFGL